MSTATVLSLSRLAQDSSDETEDLLTDSRAAKMIEFAHDIRQPLSTIEHLAYLLQVSTTDGKAAAYIEQIQDLIEQANRVLDNALAALSCADLNPNITN